MAKEKKEQKAKQELEVFSGENWSLEKDGVNIYLKSGTGFYNEERENVKIRLKVTVEEL